VFGPILRTLSSSYDPCEASFGGPFVRPQRTRFFTAKPCDAREFLEIGVRKSSIAVSMGLLSSRES